MAAAPGSGSAGAMGAALGGLQEHWPAQRLSRWGWQAWACASVALRHSGQPECRTRGTALPETSTSESLGGVLVEYLGAVWALSSFLSHF